MPKTAAVNINLKKYKYGYQIKNVSHSAVQTCVHIHSTWKHFCVKYEASRENGVVLMTFNKKKQMKLQN